MRLDNRIGFRGYGGRIQRVIAAVNTQEARAPFKRFRPQTLTFNSCRRFPESGPFLIAPRRCFAPSCALFPRRGSAAVRRRYSNRSPTAFTRSLDHRIQFTTIRVWLDIVLILADADGFRIDFYQFQRSCRLTCDRPAAQGDASRSGNPAPPAQKRNGYRTPPLR